jgi:hypothetical protein
MDGWTIFALIISVILLGIGIFLIIYGYNKRPLPGNPCKSTNQCQSDQVCTNGYCEALVCNTNSNCRAGQICTNGVCTALACQIQEDCAQSNIDVACINGRCIPLELKNDGKTTKINCNNNDDCWAGAATCDVKNKVCAQCFNNSDCPYPNYNCGKDGICYSNCSATGPNAICPVNTVCLKNTNSCCLSSDIIYGPASCGASTECGRDGFCVNGVCTCRRGKLGDTCAKEVDCDEGFTCLGRTATLAGVCVKTGSFCYYNFSENNVNPATACQTSVFPYCSDGICSANPIGSHCKCHSLVAPIPSGNMPFADISVCTKYDVCNVAGITGATGVTPLYCVDNRCQDSPGIYGSYCTSEFDCLPGKNGVRYCVPDRNNSSNNNKRMVCSYDGT